MGDLIGQGRFPKSLPTIAPAQPTQRESLETGILSEVDACLFHAAHLEMGDDLFELGAIECIRRSLAAQRALPPSKLARLDMEVNKTLAEKDHLDKPD
jgi:hypothetical protein